MITTSRPKTITAILRGTAVEREFVSVTDAEQMSSISAWTWRQMAYNGKVASSKVGRRLLIPVSEIRRILSEGMRPQKHAQINGVLSQAKNSNV